MKNYLDMNTWNRARHFSDYIGWDFPYIVVTADVDVTKLYEYVKKEGLSFYFSMIWAAKKAADEIENFRYRFDDNGVFLIDENIAYATHLHKGSELFHSVECDSFASMREFAIKNREKAELPPDESKHTKAKDREDIISFSAIPWISYSSFIKRTDTFFFLSRYSATTASWTACRSADCMKECRRS